MLQLMQEIQGTTCKCRGWSYRNEYDNFTGGNYSTGSIGVGFAYLSINRVKKIMEEIKSNGKIGKKF